MLPKLADNKGFEVIEETDSAPDKDHSAALSVLMLALKGLSQRALVAVADLFTLATVASAFWLWLSIHDPNTYQLIGLAMYGIFILAANYLVRSK